MKPKNTIIILLIALASIVSLWWYSQSCVYKTICHITMDINSPEFDCGIIYGRLSKYNVEGAVEGSTVNINATACSDEVLSILEQQFNASMKEKYCAYHCCLTDGTCYSGWGAEAINNQGYEIR